MIRGSGTRFLGMDTRNSRKQIQNISWGSVFAGYTIHFLYFVTLINRKVVFYALIIGDPGAAGREEEIFVGERILVANFRP